MLKENGHNHLNSTEYQLLISTVTRVAQKNTYFVGTMGDDKYSMNYFAVHLSPQSGLCVNKS